MIQKGKPELHEHEFTRKYIKERVDHDMQVSIKEKYDAEFSRPLMQIALDVCSCGYKVASDLLPIGVQND